MKWRHTKHPLNHTAASRGFIAKRLAALVAVTAGPYLSSTESGSAHLNETVKPQSTYPDSAGQLTWDTLRAHFRLTLTLDPSAAVWNVVQREHPQLAGGEYESGPYRLKLAEKNTGKQTCVINAFSKRTATRLEGVRGTWQAQVYDQAWHPAFKLRLKTDVKGGLNLNLAAPTECHAIVLTKRL